MKPKVVSISPISATSRKRAKNHVSALRKFGCVLGSVLRAVCPRPVDRCICLRKHGDASVATSSQSRMPPREPPPRAPRGSSSQPRVLRVEVPSPPVLPPLVCGCLRRNCLSTAAAAFQDADYPNPDVIPGEKATPAELAGNQVGTQT